ncbi:hypothetical protein CR205_15805 [Alteribacter lacisalsi]|uniref:Competence protein ComK n=1 Tax=Alteribacter lacisalsi TaxID=2045244 RepID=A0A2W0H3U0_9BACI|nr:competence protein ComK [Alteribacter lacisalsi]PYZ95847.1 hypothetical protein CR205_15805 [Alteribacter lacisalsi]
MKEIYVEEYEIGYQTLALLPNNDLTYLAKAIETDKVVYISTPCIKVIEAACLNGGSSFNGRREAVFFHTGFQKRVPVPLSISKRICAFPTESPSLHGCAWLFSQHLRKISEIEQQKSEKPRRKPMSRVHFSTGQEIELTVSKHVLVKQMTRASHCMNLFARL